MGLKILDIEKTAAFEARFKGLNKPSEGEIACQLKHPAHRRDLRIRHHHRRRAIPGDGVSGRAGLELAAGRPRPVPGQATACA